MNGIRARGAGAATVTAAGLLMASHASTLFGVVLVAATTLTFCGVVLPAVFFRDKDRRRDARVVLALILDFFRRRAR